MHLPDHPSHQLWRSDASALPLGQWVITLHKPLPQALLETLVSSFTLSARNSLIPLSQALFLSQRILQHLSGFLFFHIRYFQDRTAGLFACILMLLLQFGGGSCADHSSCPFTSALYGCVYGVPSMFPQPLQKMTDKKAREPTTVSPFPFLKNM